MTLCQDSPRRQCQWQPSFRKPGNLSIRFNIPMNHILVELTMPRLHVRCEPAISKSVTIPTIIAHEYKIVMTIFSQQIIDGQRLYFASLHNFANQSGNETEIEKFGRVKRIWIGRGNWGIDE